ncbi:MULTISPECIES: ATP phosphoribosyltransferase [Pirellulaceae]|uniref:ATP phosphoribosyltransferase n=1 Tax=Aporhodopirellula rubra TaxID=980271 RepID=A0A7W5H8P7_9BACT|nr:MULTISPECIES: ATP phosphoribosyltransferase [Pirellulaceae]EMI45398.1 ATP phosphoribosyltransferase [Rhodopirellula sp. SWK7]MBB3209634.1 ATP phosphoribosyltransferase [Aporhodopirellula rubra]
MISDSHLRLGIPSKGRLSDLATDLLTQAGLRFRRQNRGLFARVSGLNVDLVYLRTDDIPTLCAEGAIDMGITGSDLVEEAGANVQERMKFGVGRCRLAFCIPDDAPITSAAELDGKRIATSFPTVTREYLAKHGATAHLVSLAGSVEAMIQLGVADAIVDLVETGSTLAANRLRILEEIGHYETVLIQNTKPRHSEIADRLVQRLEGVVIARDYSLVEYNIPRAKISEAEKITPGFNSPTINSLENAEWCSVQVMIRRADVVDAMDQLKAIGASAVFEMTLNNCRL